MRCANGSISTCTSRLDQCVHLSCAAAGAALQIDADMYEGYFDAFFNLYDKLSIGGFVMLDDYCIVEARKAVYDFRQMHNITEPLYLTHDGMGAYWRKQQEVDLRSDVYATFRTVCADAADPAACATAQAPQII